MFRKNNYDNFTEINWNHIKKSFSKSSIYNMMDSCSKLYSTTTYITSDNLTFRAIDIKGHGHRGSHSLPPSLSLPLSLSSHITRAQRAKSPKIFVPQASLCPLRWSSERLKYFTIAGRASASTSLPGFFLPLWAKVFLSSATRRCCFLVRIEWRGSEGEGGGGGERKKVRRVRLTRRGWTVL